MAFTIHATDPTPDTNALQRSASVIGATSVWFDVVPAGFDSSTEITASDDLDTVIAAGSGDRLFNVQRRGTSAVFSLGYPHAATAFTSIPEFEIYGCDNEIEANGVWSYLGKAVPVPAPTTDMRIGDLRWTPLVDLSTNPKMALDLAGSSLIVALCSQVITTDDSGNDSDAVLRMGLLSG